MFEKLNYLDFNEAIKKSFELTNTTLSSEFVSINFAINRVVSEDILCVKNLPAFDNSLWMDLLLKQVMQDKL